MIVLAIYDITDKMVIFRGYYKELTNAVNDMIPYVHPNYKICIYRKDGDP